MGREEVPGRTDGSPRNSKVSIKVFIAVPFHWTTVAEGSANIGIDQEELGERLLISSSHFCSQELTNHSEWTAGRVGNLRNGSLEENNLLGEKDPVWWTTWMEGISVVTPWTD